MFKKWYFWVVNIYSLHKCLLIPFFKMIIIICAPVILSRRTNLAKTTLSMSMKNTTDWKMSLKSGLVHCLFSKKGPPLLHCSLVNNLAQVIYAKNCPTTFYCIFQLVWVPIPLLISTGFLKYPFRHSFQTGIKIQLWNNWKKISVLTDFFFQF